MWNTTVPRLQREINHVQSRDLYREIAQLCSMADYRRYSARTIMRNRIGMNAIIG